MKVLVYEGREEERRGSGIMYVKWDEVHTQNRYGRGM